MPTRRRAIRLFLLSHAETAATRRAAFAADEPAEPKSLAQAAAAPPRLPDDAHVLTSPALAARQTADAIGRVAQTEADLRDADWGRWRGQTLEAVAAVEPDALAAWLGDSAAAPHGGESLAALRARAGRLLARCTDRPTLAITHAALVRAALVLALDAPAASFWRIDVPPLSLLELGWNGRAWTLRQFATIPTWRSVR